MRAQAVVLAGIVSSAYALTVPAAAGAAQCGLGTFYDAPSDTCLVAAPAPEPLAPPPPPPPPPPPGPTPWVSVGVCAPIPFVNLCVGV